MTQCGYTGGEGEFAINYEKDGSTNSKQFGSVTEMDNKPQCSGITNNYSQFLTELGRNKTIPTRAFLTNALADLLMYPSQNYSIFSDSQQLMLSSWHAKLCTF